MHRRLKQSCLIALSALIVVARPVAAQAPIEYRLSFPEPQQRWMLVDVVFPDVPAGPLRLHMSRSSPGRYALHEFAKNVYDVALTDGAGRPLSASRPNLHQWEVAGHDGTVRIRYRLFGDRVDGTYLGIDATHAHINMPAALIWARGFEQRAAQVTFVQPAGRQWTVATQLFPTADPLVFTAPNQQYLFDSPSEFGPGLMRTFPAPMADGDTRPAPTIRVALHHPGGDTGVDEYVDGVRRIVEQARRLFGEYPAFENDTYTFLADYLPWANGDGMEHRNSTVLTSRGVLPDSRIGMLGTVSHEFLHAWNVERIRPRSLEPFDFADANVSTELWFAEGVTSYYDGLLLARAGLTELPDLLGELSGAVLEVMSSPATQFRSAEDMSRLAPFVDSASSIDRTNWPNTFISYYTYGAALGLGLDFSIREKTANAASLDDVMKLMWKKHGKPGGREVGYVDVPYTSADLRDAIGAVTSDGAFANDLYTRFVQGREVMDYSRLLTQAGLALRSRFPRRASLGPLALERLAGAGVRIAGPTRVGSPAYRAGLAQDDEIKAVGKTAVANPDEVEAALKSYVPGERVTVTVVSRGVETNVEVELSEDYRKEIVAVELTGGTLTDAQKAFRSKWLAGK
jgi:predicted metalloprotease with PDZ domain